MYAQRIMSSDLPVIRPEDSVGRALQLLDEYKVRHLPLVNGELFSGLVYEDDLMEADEQTPMAALEARPVMVAPQLHLYDLVAQLIEAEVDVLPVVFDGKYLGSVQGQSILRFLAEKTQWGAPGAVLVLEVPEMDLAIAEVARLVEGNDARVIACTTAREDDSTNVEVTVKVNTPDVEPILATFQRFGYSVQTFYHAPGLEAEMRERYEAFMRYLEN